MVTEFHNNPQPFIAYYKSNVSFTHFLQPDNGYDQTDLQFVEAVPQDSGGTQILVGEYCNTLENTRWNWPAVRDDIIIFAPHSTEGTFIKYDEAFAEDSETWDFINKDYTEEELFQYSTVLSNPALETLELFLYLKENCTVPFKINLLAFDLDTAIGIYGYDNR